MAQAHHGDPKTARRRYFLTMHKGFGRLVAWQYWYGVVQHAPAVDPDAPPKEIDADLLRTAFEDLWVQLQVCT